MNQSYFCTRKSGRDHQPGSGALCPLGDACSCCLEAWSHFEKEAGTSRVQELQISLDHSSSPIPPLHQLASSLLLPASLREGRTNLGCRDH